VLRRAPDNLAAIRGLAELNDRFEHTLNLPMDGPGQWPPPPESVEASADHVAASSSAVDDAVATFAAAGETGEEASVQATEPEMPPAELGVPIWTPVTPAAASGAVGMSSVREIDPGPSVAARPSPENDAVVRAIDEALDRNARAGEDIGVSEAEIQALIAESESLEASIVVEATEPEPVGSLALEATDDTDPLAAIAEVTGMDPAPAFAPAYSSVTEPIAVEVDLSATVAPEVAPMEVAEEAVVEQSLAVEQPHAILEAPPVIVEAPPVIVEMSPAVVEAPSVTVEEPQAVEAFDPNPFVLTAPELAESLVADSDDTEADVAAFAMDPDIAPLLPFTAAAAEPVFEPEAVAETVPVSVPVLEIAAEEVEVVAAAPMVAEVVSIETGMRRSPVPQLERLLTRVQARRAQLMAESVA